MRTFVRLLIVGIYVVFVSAVQAQMPVDGQNQAEILKL